MRDAVEDTGVEMRRPTERDGRASGMGKGAKNAGGVKRYAEKSERETRGSAEGVPPRTPS